MKATIYHNPKCGTSRNVMKILKENNVDITVIEYLKEPLSVEELKELLSKLNLESEGLMRKNQDEYSLIILIHQRMLLPSMAEDEKIKTIHKNPILMERPIVITSKGAKICRPKEVVYDLL
jgi:arsenate reductase